MLFLVTRTSGYDHERPPCEEAFKTNYLRKDVRSVDDPQKVLGQNGESDWWYLEGQNHRVEDGKMVRDFSGTAWFVDLPSLEALIEFSKKHGELVFDCSRADYPEIEIYDDFRE